MPTGTVIVVSRKTDISKQIRYTVDQGCRNKKIILSASTENTNTLLRMLDILTFMECVIESKTRGRSTSNRRVGENRKI